MPRIRKLERDFATADLAAVSSLIGQLTDEDFVLRHGLESRQREAQEALVRFIEEPDEKGASAALFFGGRPVIGSRGIESEFGGEALTKFQDLVAKVLAHKAGGLGQRGIVPNKGAATLHITNVVRGSFGFLLEEAQSQQQIVDTELKSAVDQTSHLLEAFGEPNEELFRAAVETIDQRVLVTARDFFNLMRREGATLRLVAGSIDSSFSTDAVVRAAERATSTAVEDDDEEIFGQLAGVLPDAHQFEFRTTSDRGTIRGRVDKNLTAIQLAQYNHRWLDQDSLARVQVKKILRNGVLDREIFMLLEILEPR